jgi:hypothetical protein
VLTYQRPPGAEPALRPTRQICLKLRPWHPSNDGDATFWYLALPSGQQAELGPQDILAGTCAFGHALIACLDTRGRLGLWRYR